MPHGLRVHNLCYTVPKTRTGTRTEVGNVRNRGDTPFRGSVFKILLVTFGAFQSATVSHQTTQNYSIRFILITGSDHHNTCRAVAGMPVPGPPAAFPVPTFRVKRGCGIGRPFLPCNAAQRFGGWFEIRNSGNSKTSQEVCFGRTAESPTSTSTTHTHSLPHAIGSNCG